MTKNMKIIVTVLFVILICFIYLICRFYLNVNSAEKKDESSMKSVNELGEHFYSFGEKGMYGVKDSHDNIVISPKWHSISQLTHDRYIVSKQEPTGLLYGIIDLNENVVVPFIYSKITNEMNEFLIGSIEHENGTGYVLMNISGNAIVEDEWESVSKNIEEKTIDEPSNYIEVSKDNNTYRFVRRDDIYLLDYMKLERKIFDGDNEIESEDITDSGLSCSDYILYTQLVDNSLKYISTLFSNDYTAVKELSFDEDYDDLIPQDIDFRGGTPVYADSVIPMVSTEDGITTYKCEITFLYTSPESIQWDGSVTPSENAVKATVLMKKNENGYLRIFSSSVEDIGTDSLDKEKYESYCEKNPHQSGQAESTYEQYDDDEDSLDSYEPSQTNDQYTGNDE